MCDIVRVFGDWALCGVLRDGGSFFFQAEDGIRDLVRSRGLGDVYKRQSYISSVSLLYSPTGMYAMTGMLPRALLLIVLLVLSLIHI